MPKLLEKNGAELIASLVNIAEPVGRIVDDEALFSAIVEATKKVDKSPFRKGNIPYIMTMYATVVPLLFTETHIKDVLAILAEIEGGDANEMLAKNGADLVADFIAAWKEQIGPFAKRCGLMA